MPRRAAWQRLTLAQFCTLMEPTVRQHRAEQSRFVTELAEKFAMPRSQTKRIIRSTQHAMLAARQVQ
jgi:hypothetical protein